MACFGVASRISLVEPDLKEPPVPEPLENKKDAQGAMVTTADRIPKWVDKNAMLFGMEITLYTDTDTVKMIRKKQDKWLNIRAKIFHLVL